MPNQLLLSHRRRLLQHNCTLWSKQRQHWRLYTTAFLATRSNNRICKFSTAAANNIGSNTSSSIGSSSSSSTATTRLPYGLKRLDYYNPNTPPPPKWRTPADPPDDRSALQRSIPYVQAGLAFGVFGMIYFNQDESVLEYWRAVERGTVPDGAESNSDDHDDDDDDADNNDDDEWADVAKKIDALRKRAAKSKD